MINFGNKLQEASTPALPVQTNVQPVQNVQPAQTNASIFLSGAVAQAAFVEHAKQQAVRDANRESSVFRFFLGKDSTAPGQYLSAEATFLTGAIDPATGALDVPVLWEHNIKLNGRYGNTFLCTLAQEGSCPCCEAGFSNYLASYFYVIDHSTYTKDGTAYFNNLKLLVAKPASRNTFESLAKNSEVLKGEAATGSGLVLQTFDVTRSGGQKVAAIGDSFILKSQCSSLEELVQGMVQMGTPLGEAQKRVNPPAIEQVVPYKTAAEISALMGGGNPTPSTGFSHTGMVQDTPVGLTLEQSLQAMQKKL